MKTNKLKRRGFILFEYYKQFVANEYCKTINEMYAQYDNAIDDIWDMKGRNRMHFFYLDIAANKYVPLPRWKKDYDPKLNFDQSDKKVLSTKTF